MQIPDERWRLSGESGRSHPWRMLVYAVLIAAGALVLWLEGTGRVQPLFQAPPPPTRAAASYVEQGRTLFSAGALDRAIEAYSQAVVLSPDDARAWAELARVQAYSSALRTTAEERRARLAEARQSADRAVEADPESALAQAVRALAYDWSAGAEDTVLGIGRREEFLREAQASIARALQIEPGNPLAMAFNAEILVEEFKVVQALDVAAQAAALADDRDPLSMDIHRVYGTVLEHSGQYRRAIEEYLRATDIAPNFTYLYLRIGANYRQLREIDTALDFFDRAARINQQLGIMDPTPYLAIGRTYMQQGQFFISARNIARALAIDPSNPDIYGRLGIVFFRARNYESAVIVLRCAVDGCTVEDTRALLCEYVYGCDPQSPQAEAYGVEVVGLGLGAGSLEYYYTYGSVLTYFRNTTEYPTACDDADRVFRTLETQYADDPIVAGIAAESRSLCGLPGGPAATPTATPGAGG